MLNEETKLCDFLNRIFEKTHSYYEFDEEHFEISEYFKDDPRGLSSKFFGNYNSVIFNDSLLITFNLDSRHPDYFRNSQLIQSTSNYSEVKSIITTINKNESFLSRLNAFKDSSRQVIIENFTWYQNKLYYIPDIIMVNEKGNKRRDSFEIRPLKEYKMLDIDEYYANKYYSPVINKLLDDMSDDEKLLISMFYL